MDSILEVLIIAIICLLLQKVNKSNEISKDTLSVVTFDKKNQKDGMLLSRNNSQIKEKPDQELIEQKNVESSKNNSESNLKSKTGPTTMVIDPYDHHFLAHKHSESSISTNSSGYEDFFDAQQGSSPVSTTKIIGNLDSIKGGNPVPTTTARINQTTSLPDGVSGVPFVSGRNMDESKNKKTTDSAKTVSYATNPDVVNGNSQYLASNQKNTIDSSKESRGELSRDNSLNSSKPVTYYRHRTENSLPYQYAQHQYPFQQHPPENTTHLEITQASQTPSAQFQPVYPFDLPINITTSKPDAPTSTTKVPKSIASSFRLARDLSSIEGSVHGSSEEEETKKQSYQERKVQQEGEKNQELNRNTKATKHCSVLNNGNSEDNRGVYKTSMLGRSVSLSSANPSKSQKKKYSNIKKSPPILGKADVKTKNDDSDNYLNIDKSPVYYNSGLETATLISEDGPILISDGFSILSLPSNNNKGQRSETVKPKRPKHKRGLSEGSIMAKYLEVEATSSSASSSSGIHKTLKLTDDQSNSDYNSSAQLDQQLNIKKRHQRKNLIEEDRTIIFTGESEKSVANGDFESSAGKGVCVNQHDKNRNNIKFMEERNDNNKSAPPQSHHHPTTNSTYNINNNNINTKNIDNNNTNCNHRNNNDSANNSDHELLFQKLHSKKRYELTSTSDQLLPPPPTKSDRINRYIEYSNFPSPLEAIAAQAIKEQNKLMARGNKSSSSSRKSDKSAESATKQPQKSRSRGLPNEYQGIGEDEFPTLSANGLYAFDVMGDGNCLFRALSDQYFGDGGKHHMKIRQMTVDYMAEHADDFRMFITDETWEQHLKRMKKDGVFGDQAEIVSFSRCANVDISIHQRDTEPLLIRPNGGDKDTRRSGEKNVRPTLHIAYHYWEHYSSVRRIDGPYTGPPQINLRFRSGGIPDNSTEVYATKNAQRRRNREHECVQMILGSLHYTVSEEVVRNELKRFGGNGDSALEYMLTHQDQFDEELIKERKIKEQQLIQLQKQQQLQEKEEERRRRRRSSKNTNTTTSSSDHYSSSSSRHYHKSAASNELATGSVAPLPPGYSSHGGAMTGGLDVLDGHQKDMDLNKPLPPLPKHHSASSRHPTSSYPGSGGGGNSHENNVSIPPRSSSLPQHKAHTASVSTTSSSGNNSSRHSRTHSASIVTPATSSSSTSSSHGSHRHYRSHSSVSSSGVAGAPTVVDPSVIAAYKSSSQSHHPSSLHSHQHGLVAPTVPVSSSSSSSSHSHYSSGATPLSGDNVKLTSSSSTRDPSSSHGTRVSTSGNSSSSTATDKPTRPKKLTAREKKDRQKYEASQRRKAKRLAEAAAAAGGNGGSTGRDNEDDGAISIRAIAI